MKVVERQSINRRIDGKLRWLLIRFLAGVVVCFPLVLVEGVLRLWVPDPGLPLEDPYISFGELRPLFVPDASGTILETAPERLRYFCPQSFSASKSSQTYRIFCLGGSTVQGRPLSVETAFSTWLKLNLEVLCPDRAIEMVNCGGISYASYRLVPLMEELLQYQPDLFILYTGHNEFLEDRTYRRLKNVPRMLIGLHHRLLHLRTYQLVDRYLASRGNSDESKTVLSTEVKTKLDVKTGLSTYHRDPVWQQGIIEHFRRNLEVLVQTAQRADVPIILMNPVSNLKDCPPFKSEFGRDQSQEDQDRVIALWEQARQGDTSDPWSRLHLLEQAAALDDQHAGLLYQLGISYAQTGRFSEAKSYFLAAKEQDICPLRMLEPMHQTVKEVASRHGIPLVDVRELIEQRSAHRIPGQEWFSDHVHPNINGHQLIADALTDCLAEQQLFRYPDHWREEREQLWQTHLQSLGDIYYQDGFTHLRMLENWSGRRIPRNRLRGRDPNAP